MRRLVTLALIAAAAGAAGCGNRDEQGAVRSTVARFYAAVAHEDGRAACAELSQPTIQQLVSSEGTSCRKAVVGLKLHGGRPGSTTVYELNAAVQLAGGDRVFLSRDPDGWKVDAAGCSTQGPPATHPFDCLLQD